MLQLYRYKPLSAVTKPDKIRLLELLPGSGDKQIVCALIETALSDNPAYEALSYCWGKDTVQEPVIIKHPTGTDFSSSVGANLFAALRQFRDSESSIYLWVDALCINQSDEEERSNQVLLMRQIYEGAKKTRIWLGPEDENTWKAFSLMRKLVSAKSAQDAKKDTRFYYEMGVNGQSEYGLPYPLDPSFKAFSALLGREWFSRVWIIQEVAVSKRVALECGHWSISWDDFVSSIDYATTIIIPGIWANTTNCQRIFQLVAARASVSMKYEQSLLSLVSLYRNFNATDMRDKIYSLLGVAQESGMDALLIRPDYTTEASEVYRNFTISILQQSKVLDILSVPRVSNASGFNHLPSWVADWSVSDFAHSFRFMMHSKKYAFDFEASPGGCKSKPKFCEDKSVLVLEGHIVDEIEEAGEVHSHQAEGELTFLQRIGRIAGEQSVLNGWEKISKARSGGKYPRTEEDILAAFWQTLSAGQKPQGFHAANEEYEAWDRCVRTPSRFVPTAKWLKWTHSFLSLPVMVGTGIAMATSTKSTKEIMNFRSKMTVATQRRMIRTKEGLIGLAPEHARKGDFVFLFKGGMVPLVLRKVEKIKSRWTLIGDSYVHGIMHGEAFDGAKCTEIWIQ